MLGALAGIFTQIEHGDEQIRERAITFLSTKIRLLLVEDMLPKDAEEELVTLCKKVIGILLLFSHQKMKLLKAICFTSESSFSFFSLHFM